MIGWLLAGAAIYIGIVKSSPWWDALVRDPEQPSGAWWDDDAPDLHVVRTGEQLAADVARSRSSSFPWGGAA